MRVRTALAALALATAGLLGGSAPAAASTAPTGIEFGDIFVSSEDNPAGVGGCNAGTVSLSPSAQCGLFHIAPA
ncbi:hypothetical protein ABT354_22195 [Streptomyces sp. NPDC000594]|uniref:hypothetical protein n=1 Tax=Streptomyces sp. NPDC000594 TaxID=3154261 RepID=UPI0033305E77